MTTITEQVRAAAEEIERGIYKAFSPNTPDDDIDLADWVKTTTRLDVAEIINKHVHPASLAEPKKLVDEIDDLLSEAIGYDYTNRGPAMIALERLVERNLAPVGPSLTDAIEVVKRLRANIENEPENNGYESALNDAITTLESLQGKAPEPEPRTAEAIVKFCESTAFPFNEKVAYVQQALWLLESVAVPEGKAPVGEWQRGMESAIKIAQSFGDHYMARTIAIAIRNAIDTATTPSSGEVPPGGSENEC